MNYRNLTDAEIQSLEKNLCSAEDWSRVRVTDGFAPGNIRSAAFSGDVRLGRLEGKITLPGGVEAASGIQNAALHNTTVGDGVLIRNIGRHIANYDIADGAVVDNVDLLVTEGESTFGNGASVEAVNEGGGREVKIFDRLSSQIAYILAFYRHRPEVVERIEAAIDRYADGVKSSRGAIGENARVMGCGTVVNVRVGPSARVEGARKLANGTVNSSPADPAYVGDGVIVENFILSSGSRISDAAILTDCFVGQGVRVGRQYAAENSLFFANSEAYHGEGCAVFAGPYTVTHHKSSLLIAGLFSFYNAGSGTNMSNHLYKLGPIQQGILERGSKTGSFAYLLFSSRLGAFSVAIGKHFSNFDIADFPFSYVMESGGKSILIPGFNLTTVGTWRDGAKWPKRDRRKDPDLLDLIRFDVLSPYTVQKMRNGRRILRDLEAQTPSDRKAVDYQGVQIPRSRFQKGIDAYDLGIQVYLGGKIARRLEALLDGGQTGDLLPALLETAGGGLGQWVDVSGLLAPRSQVEALLDRIAGGAAGDLAALETELRSLHESYAELEWDWILDAWLGEIGKKTEDITIQDISDTIRQWKEIAQKHNDMVLADARKEFEGDALTGFGVDGDAQTAAADFKAVRGDYDTNKFVREVRQNTADAIALADKILTVLD